MIKAISLLSGGLDSILATKLILEQGIEVEGVHFSSVFAQNRKPNQKDLLSEIVENNLGIKLKTIDYSQELIKLVKNPRHGYGSNMNPCIDCHMRMFVIAAEYMKKINASFLITGEVLGERPMSQRKGALALIDKESGLGGLILRPLSAKLLEPTTPELQGLVDRERLLDISGRSRKKQIELAAQFGIKEYPNPAGGCLLTDPEFSRKLKDLMGHKKDFTVSDVALLKAGRHFRLSEEATLVIGRDEHENEALLQLAQGTDICFEPSIVPGPSAIGRGVFNDELINKSAGVIARYSDRGLEDKVNISYKRHREEQMQTISVLPMEDAEIDNFRIVHL